MPSRKTVTAANLEALGAAPLASLLVELADGDAALKRRLRGLLAAAEGPTAAAQEVRKRLATLAKARSFIDWRRNGPLAEDLDAQRTAIVGQILPADPGLALDLLWRLMALAEPTLSLERGLVQRQQRPRRGRVPRRLRRPLRRRRSGAARPDRARRLRRHRLPRLRPGRRPHSTPNANVRRPRGDHGENHGTRRASATQRSRLTQAIRERGGALPSRAPRRRVLLAPWRPRSSPCGHPAR